MSPPPHGQLEEEASETQFVCRAAIFPSEGLLLGRAGRVESSTTTTTTTTTTMPVVAFVLRLSHISDEAPVPSQNNSRGSLCAPLQLKLLQSASRFCSSRHLGLHRESLPRAKCRSVWHLRPRRLLKRVLTRCWRYLHGVDTRCRIGLHANHRGKE